MLSNNLINVPNKKGENTMKKVNSNEARLARAKTGMAAIKSTMPKGTISTPQTVRVTATCKRLQPHGIVVSCFARANSLHVLVPVLGVKIGFTDVDRNGTPRTIIANGADQKAQLAAVGAKLAAALKS